VAPVDDPVVVDKQAVHVGASLNGAANEVDLVGGCPWCSSCLVSHWLLGT